MNSLSPPILSDNTEVNGKMKMKCLNINGSNITEIVTGPKIVYRSGERSFLKSISIDGYRFTVSYIDDLFQGSTVECNLRRNGLDVIFVSLDSNGNSNISGGSYNSVRKSWKTISFNIDADIQDGYMRLQNHTGLFVGGTLTFDFILPPPSEHTLYSSFISDMKYISGNTEVTKIIDGNGKNDAELLDIANNNKPCLIISYSPSLSTDPNILTLVLNNSTTPNPVFYRAISSIPEPMSLRNVHSEGAQNSYTDEAAPLKAWDMVPERLRELKALSAEFRRTNDRVNELEYKLRKFGIE